MIQRAGNPGTSAGGPIVQAGAGGSTPNGPEKRLRQACADFEGIFLSQLFAQMRQTVPNDGIVDGGAGEDMFTSMMDEHVAAAASVRMERGVGAALYRQLKGRLAPEAEASAAKPAAAPSAPAASPPAPAAIAPVVPGSLLSREDK